MKREDTLDKAASKLLTKQMDLSNYLIHRQKLVDMQPVNRVGNGLHIQKINKNKDAQLSKERQDGIETDNMHLFNKIREVMTRKTYSKDRGSPRVFNRPSWPDNYLHPDITSGKMNKDMSDLIVRAKHN